MIQGRAWRKRIRIRLRAVRLEGTPKVRGPFRMADRFSGPCKPAWNQESREAVADAADALERALLALDPLLFRRSGMEDEELADVHEAIGLIVEGLAVLSRGYRRLGRKSPSREIRQGFGSGTLVA